MKKKLMSIVCAGAVLFGVSGFASASDLDGDIKTSGSVTIDAPQQRYHVNVGGDTGVMELMMNTRQVKNMHGQIINIMKEHMHHLLN